MIRMLLQFAYMPDFLEIDSNLQVSVVSGVGFDTSCISENPIAAYIGLKRCKELLGFFAFFFKLSLYFKLFSRRKSEILGCIAKEFSCFRNISAI